MTQAILAQSKPQRQVPFSHTSQERIQQPALIGYGNPKPLQTKVRKYSNKLAYQTSSHNDLAFLQGKMGGRT